METSHFAGQPHYRYWLMNEFRGWRSNTDTQRHTPQELSSEIRQADSEARGEVRSLVNACQAHRVGEARL